MHRSNISMIDISEKKDSLRIAIAEGKIKLKKSTIKLIKENKIKKGDVLSNGELAAINAVKKTPDFIFLAHPIPIMGIEVNFEIDLDNAFIKARVEVKSQGKTGVELEAILGVQIALLTIWDMTKYVEKDKDGQYPETEIVEVKVIKKIKEV
ncbi:MAG: cyclic pyranopterin monophosphate synthase MoaC [Candidatus Lokiarchaeota archaeon]|nr:cyclic pyranopterin monophosphate synthase MoaC [Candidatus Lokiarchaeota archaeon]